MTIEDAWAEVESHVRLHTECCFKADRGKKEKSREECIRDTLAAVLDLVLAAFDEGAVAAFPRPISEQRPNVEPDILIRIGRRRAYLAALLSGEGGKHGYSS